MSQIKVSHRSARSVTFLTQLIQRYTNTPCTCVTQEEKTVVCHLKKCCKYKQRKGCRQSIWWRQNARNSSWQCSWKIHKYANTDLAKVENTQQIVLLQIFYFLLSKDQTDHYEEKWKNWPSWHSWRHPPRWSARQKWLLASSPANNLECEKVILTFFPKAKSPLYLPPI